MWIHFRSIDEGAIVLGNAEGFITGTYEAMDENYAIPIVFEEAEYYAVFTEIDEEVVMILVNKAEKPPTTVDKY